MKIPVSKFKQVKLLVLDVDGVLTDGRMFYRDDGEFFKAFHVQDGLGVHLLAKSGIKVVMLTSKDTVMLAKRAQEMHITEVITGVAAKHEKLTYLIKQYRVSPEQICFIGDDLVDIELIKSVGIPVAVKNARNEVKRFACYTTTHSGGDGAVREVVELILKSQGRWKWVLENLHALLP